MYDNYTQIAVSLENRVATLAFNREKELNSFSASLKTECTDALNRLSEDSAVGVVVITGRGRHFCAGGNIPELKSYIDTGVYITPEVALLTIDWIRAIRACKKPVIAMINGAAMGGGAAVASACDFRFMQPSGKFAMAFINIGLSCDSGSMYSLSRIVGPSKALDIVMTGEVYKGEAAEKIGWARLTNEGKLEEETYAFANMLAARPGAALTRDKQLANAIFWSDFERYEQLEIQAVVESGKTYDHNEGLTAFLEKRAPNFEGR